MAISIGLTTTACTIGLPGDPVPAIDVSASLPFKPTIVERVNGRNDGTSFEPCVAYSATELSALGINGASVSDAGFSESPNYRGCHWTSQDAATQYSQIVGDEASLETYKRKHSYRQWRPDRVASGRTVAIAPDSNDGCIAAFISRDAVVATIVAGNLSKPPSAGLQEECDKAFAFASLAASKAP
ncbi:MULTISPECIES: DUF3558 family protein [Tsukamurella]|uniref:DUF3558 family protein n=1 Tax=Tsukamurella strandjordii TaxID=147577 RepID=A0AA90NDC2_9ACTN|nr:MULTISPECIES: DUF3558 family protein [Tsukamurella]MDP0400246.1 DUF3558 family protein [Tsukamurella strandjordii]GIZ98514.1 hypothetical protein TTY48_31260 [Tsukamurella sp. TY48]